VECCPFPFEFSLSPKRCRFSLVLPNQRPPYSSLTVTEGWFFINVVILFFFGGFAQFRLLFIGSSVENSSRCGGDRILAQTNEAHIAVIEVGCLGKRSRDMAD